MAKAEKTTKKSKTEEAPAKKVGASAKDMGFKYGVTDLADAMGIEPASVRVALRNKGIEKAGAAYGWNTKAERDEVIAKLQAKSERAAPTAKKAKKEEPAPKAKKSSKSDDAPKAAKKSTKRSAESQQAAEA